MLSPSAPPLIWLNKPTHFSVFVCTLCSVHLRFSECPCEGAPSLHPGMLLPPQTKDKTIFKPGKGQRDWMCRNTHAAALANKCASKPHQPRELISFCVIMRSFDKNTKIESPILSRRCFVSNRECFHSVMLFGGLFCVCSSQQWLPGSCHGLATREEDM